jgi:hypothetical protein
MTYGHRDHGRPVSPTDSRPVKKRARHMLQNHESHAGVREKILHQTRTIGFDAQSREFATKSANAF